MLLKGSISAVGYNFVVCLFILVLVNCTYEPRLAMPEFANYIISRSHNSSWVVSFKALITIHHLMNCGSEVRSFHFPVYFVKLLKGFMNNFYFFQRFSQYLASNNCQLAVPRNFEKSSSTGLFYYYMPHTL